MTVRRTTVVALDALALLVVLAAALLTGGDDGTGTGAAAPTAPAPTPVAPVPPEELSTYTAAEAGRAFLTGYVRENGRVVRTDQGGDTVSEGQAYAMLVAVGLGDADTFERVWGWTRDNLQRPDGLLSWRWADGRVADESSASDADLDAARALVLAGERFGRPDHTATGLALGQAVLDLETVQTK